MQLYRLDAAAARIASVFGVEAGDDPWAGDYVAPGRPAPVIAPDSRGGARRFLRPKLWGVPPPPRGTVTAFRRTLRSDRKIRNRTLKDMVARGEVAPGASKVCESVWDLANSLQTASADYAIPSQLPHLTHRGAAAPNTNWLA